MAGMLLMPSDVLHPGRVDEHFAAEAAAARSAGIEVSLVDHDALAAGSAEPAIARVGGTGPAVYRGWMLRSEHYAGLEAALRRRGVRLRTGAAQYRRAHELPGWYPDFADLTPPSTWTTGTGRAGFDAAARELGAGPAVLRDHTKSMKHHWDEAAYVPELADRDAAWAVASRFVELRGSELVGGFVLRRFERFVSAEVRTWWVDGVCRLVGPHPDTADDLPAELPDPAGFGQVVGRLGLPFVTADLVRRDDGRWRLVELGDGQVSDRPRTVTADRFVAELIAPQFG
jgi:hypothetical protein